MGRAEYQDAHTRTHTRFFMGNYPSPCPYPFLRVFTLPVVGKFAGAHWGWVKLPSLIPYQFMSFAISFMVFGYSFVIHVCWKPCTISYNFHSLTLIFIEFEMAR